MNYAQNITFYQCFSIKVIVIQQKVSCFQIVSIVYLQYKLISLRMQRLHFLLSYVGQVCIIKRPSSFMTRGKLLNNITTLFIFISILMMTQLHPRDPENRQQNQFSERQFSEKKQLQPVEWESVAYWLIMHSLCPLT